jgi:hypothetical protein
MVNTPEATGVSLLLTAAAALTQGNIGCQAANGTAVQAGDTASIRAVGRIEADAANGATDASIRPGCYILTNGAGGEAFAATDLIGTVAYFTGAKTVGKVGGSNKAVAGLFVSLITEGVVVDMSPAAVAAARALAPTTNVAALTGTLTGTVNGALVDVAAAAGACAGGSSPTAGNVDAAIATAVATIVSGVNEQNKELLTKINAILSALVAKGVIAAP